MKLNLGCEIHKFKDFINIDIDKSVNPDLLCDIKKLPYEDNSVDFIYAGHLLEHLYYDLVPEYLSEWRRVLKIGGKLVIVVPDVGGSMKRYAKGEYSIDHLLAQVFGRYYSWDTVEQRHQFIYDIYKLKESVQRVSWSAVEELNWAAPPVEIAEFIGTEISAADWQIGCVLTK